MRSYYAKQVIFEVHLNKKIGKFNVILVLITSLWFKQIIFVIKKNSPVKVLNFAVIEQFIMIATTYRRNSRKNY